MTKQHDYMFLETRIKGCKTVEDTYKVFSEISDYLGAYIVTERTYRRIFNLCMEKYNELK